jgi:transcriptional regulator with XRE-family HTH domain
MKINKYVKEESFMDSQVLINIGKKLQEARKKAGLTQEQVAKLLDINKVQLSYYENGSREISISLLEKLSTLYGYDTKYFLGNEPASEPDIQIAFRGNDLCDEDLEVILFAKTFLNNLSEMQILQRM